jgi:hypothetical protein
MARVPHHDPSVADGAPFSDERASDGHPRVHATTGGTVPTMAHCVPALRSAGRASSSFDIALIETPPMSCRRRERIRLTIWSMTWNLSGASDVALVWVWRPDGSGVPMDLASRWIWQP